MSEVRHECGAAANAGDSGGVTAANGDSRVTPQVTTAELKAAAEPPRHHSP